MRRRINGLSNKYEKEELNYPASLQALTCRDDFKQSLLGFKMDAQDPVLCVVHSDAAPLLSWLTNREGLVGDAFGYYDSSAVAMLTDKGQCLSQHSPYAPCISRSQFSPRARTPAKIANYILWRTHSQGWKIEALENELPHNSRVCQ